MRFGCEVTKSIEEGGSEVFAGDETIARLVTTLSPSKDGMVERASVSV